MSGESPAPKAAASAIVVAMPTREPSAGTARALRPGRPGLAIIFFALAAVFAACAARYGELAAWPLPALFVAACGAGLCTAAAAIAARKMSPAWPWVTLAAASGTAFAGVLIAITQTFAGTH